jgi:hypothetical protein
LLSGAPADPSLAQLTKSVTDLGVEEIGWLVAGIIVLTVLLHPLQRAMVRLLEGYPLQHGIGAVLGRPLLLRWQRALDRLTEAQQHPGSVSTAQQASMNRAAEKLRRLPARTRLLPTKLGNTLRAAEDEARQLYGIETVVVWPLVYPLVSDKLAAGLQDARDRLDVAARFSITFAITGVVSGLLLRTWWALPVAAVLLLAAVLSYAAADSAADVYGQLINAAVALHRFDLLKALHLPLPATPEEERDTYRRLALLLRRRVVDKSVRFAHPS